ncbi:hypothetical protein Rhopal_007607-T1 [Rhodotorula paludigena]|uniref:Uncharacterized protein n=1 Tax=Rhodotorula paludigena TaxID=86838 RepID=A0AAV5GVG0_9BASI|nr:hypothetical protein Rhopal_007607-T1 [Rhodotorula paludigena]
MAILRSAFPGALYSALPIACYAAEVVVAFPALGYSLYHQLALFLVATAVLMQLGVESAAERKELKFSIIINYTALAGGIHVAGGVLIRLLLDSNSSHSVIVWAKGYAIGSAPVVLLVMHDFLSTGIGLSAAEAEQLVQLRAKQAKDREERERELKAWYDCGFRAATEHYRSQRPVPR